MNDQLFTYSASQQLQSRASQCGTTAPRTTASSYGIRAPSLPATHKVQRQSAPPATSTQSASTQPHLEVKLFESLAHGIERLHINGHFVRLGPREPPGRVVHGHEPLRAQVVVVRDALPVGSRYHRILRRRRQRGQRRVPLRHRVHHICAVLPDPVELAVRQLLALPEAAPEGPALSLRQVLPGHRVHAALE
ncbi:hypothetical protein ON010_g2037 [Phytophthora cinnamomi]|nr:hypothetical protein ON010_g2037 [Phytophthora cinnamomi]